jgi:hypothetical protein
MNMDNSFWNANYIHRKTLRSNPMGRWGGGGHVYQCAFVGEGVWRQNVGLRAIKVIALVDGSDNQSFSLRCKSPGICPLPWRWLKLPKSFVLASLLAFRIHFHYIFFNWALTRVHTRREETAEMKFLRPPGHRSWLRHYATSRKVAGSIQDEVIGFFNWPNPSSRIMKLGSTQPLTEISTRNLPGGKGRPERKADNLTAICEVGASTSHNPMGLHGLLQVQLYLYLTWTWALWSWIQQYDTHSTGNF